MPQQAVRAVGEAPAPTGPVVGPGFGFRTVRSRAPLRLGLAGGGTDVSPYCDLFGGLVLNATIDRYCHSTVQWREGSLVEFHAADLGISAVGLAKTDLPLHKAVYVRLCRQFELGEPGLSVTTAMDAPAGSGLGSSSTLVVSLIEAFREYFALPLGDYDVAQLAYSIERDDCGLAGGRQDQYAATFGGFNVMEFGAEKRAIVNPIRLKSAIIHELEASLVLFFMGASRASAAIIERQARHVAGGDMRRVSATDSLKVEVLRMKDALLMGDLGLVAEVLRQGWDAKKQLADGISTSEIDKVFEVAYSAGATAGKVSGAGGGGYAMFLVDPTKRPTLLEALRAQMTGYVEPAHFVVDGAVAWTVK